MTQIAEYPVDVEDIVKVSGVKALDGARLKVRPGTIRPHG